MKKFSLSAAVVALAVGGMAVPAMAHHSAAMFDMHKTVSITGNVKEFQYTNPHSWLQVMTRDKNGKTVLWGFEAEGPSTLLRAGIKYSTFKPGMKVTVMGHPMKDGRPAASLMSVKLPNGTVVHPFPVMPKKNKKSS